MILANSSLNFGFPGSYSAPMRNSTGLLLCALLFSSKTFAYVPEEGKVTGTFGPLASVTDFRGSPAGDDTPWYGGFGIIANGDAYSGGGLEIGMFYLTKAYVREDMGKYLAEKTRLLHITMGYRWWLNELYSVSAALSSGYPMGDPERLFNEFPSGAEPDTSARDIVEYGIDFSAQAELWARGPNSIVLDLRYGASLTPKKSEEANHIMGLIAFKQVIQEKSRK